MGQLVSAIYMSSNQLKWARHYWKLCFRALHRELPDEVYIERHHMFPKCMYGNNKILVSLLPEEHYVAHQLLVKMYPNNKKLVYAANYLGGRKQSNNKQYGWLKRKLSEVNKGKEFSEETKRKISESQKGRVAWNKGIKMVGERKPRPPISEETRQKMSVAQKGKIGTMTGRHHTEEARIKISQASKGRKRSKEVRQKISQTLKGRISPTKGLNRTEESKLKTNKAMKGRKHSEEAKQNMQKAWEQRRLLYGNNGRK